jgi:carbon storage regulator CsrA
MLVLSRRVGEAIAIGDGTMVTLLAVDGQRVRLGVDAPPDVRILRGELGFEAADGMAIGNAVSRRRHGRGALSAPKRR